MLRGRRGDVIKIILWTGDGMNLYAKRLERGCFVCGRRTRKQSHAFP
ncbi:IS66 family insertion sequence element accessory protein TnpB [Paraburkholderia strydomiana]